MPVAMYHYVNDWGGGITLSPACFEEHCRALAEKGWRGVSLEEAEAFCIDGEALPQKSLLFTFDDGFYDNYLIAQPLLHAHGHKGVVFMVTNRLEEGAAPRTALDAVLAGRAQVPSCVAMPRVTTSQQFTVRKDVFLNKAEAAAMDARGILAVASHSRGHYGVYTGPEYKRFFKPRALGRTFYRTEAEPVWGLPDFQVKPGLLHRAFVPAPELVEAVRRFVPQNFDDAAAFFAEPGNEDGLREVVAGFAGRMGRYESEDERKERMWREIAVGKEELEAVLGHPVRTLCWPWGEYSAQALQLARDAGFRLFLTTREGVNPPGQPLAVHRFKGKAKSGAWLASRAWLYANPLLGRLYAMLRI